MPLPGAKKTLIRAIKDETEKCKDFKILNYLFDWIQNYDSSKENTGSFFKWLSFLPKNLSSMFNERMTLSRESIQIMPWSGVGTVNVGQTINEDLPYSGALQSHSLAMSMLLQCPHMVLTKPTQVKFYMHLEIVRVSLKIRRYVAITSLLRTFNRAIQFITHHWICKPRAQFKEATHQRRELGSLIEISH